MMKSPIVAALVALVASSSIASADMVKPEVKKPLITSTQSLPVFVGFALSGNNSGSHGG
jgi:opacity protein-like surface antigen